MGNCYSKQPGRLLSPCKPIIYRCPNAHYPTFLLAFILTFLLALFLATPFKTALYLAQRAMTALRALSLRCSWVSLLALAGPPLRPPLRPSATACGSLLVAEGETSLFNVFFFVATS
jgi:hypothetical protein